MEKTITNQVGLQSVETHDMNDGQTRIEVTLSLNNRTELVEKISQSSDEAILNAVGLATLDAIRILISRPLECQLDYVKKMDGKPSATVQCLLRLRDSGKETFLSGSAIIGSSLYESAVNSVLDALGRTLERMIELQQKRDRIGRSGAFAALDANTMAVATNISEKQQEAISEAKEAKIESQAATLNKTTDSTITKEQTQPTKEQATSDNTINELINVTRAKELYDQGEALVRKGNYEQASNLLKEAINLDISNADYYCQLAIALSNIRAYEEAEVAFLKAIELKPNCANYHTELGLFYKEIGRIDKSEKSLQQSIALDNSDARAKRALVNVRELMCTFEPTSKDKFTSTQDIDNARLSEIKNSIKNKPISKFNGLFSQSLSTKVVVLGLGVILAFLASIAAGMYFYNYWSITSSNKLSEADLAQPNYVALKIVHNFPSATKGLSVKESVDKYLKEQNISIYNWVAVKQSKTGHYIVVITFTNAKNGTTQSAFWIVELDKKFCTPGNNLAKQFSSN